MRFLKIRVGGMIEMSGRHDKRNNRKKTRVAGIIEK